MFRLHKQKSDKSGERFDFKFSSFQALQVPKGWDKLFVSIISVDTGKTITKSSKASVRNGNCRWTETFSESIWIAQGDTSKVVDECLFKLVVAMGSSRSGFLGETTINLASYISSKSSIPLTLPLKKCNHGTVLQVKIQCLTPREKLRDEQWKDTDSYLEDGSLEYDDLENKSDVSDGTFTRSVGSSSSNHLESTLHPGELSSREASFSASDSRNSFDSLDGSFNRENYSPYNGVMSNQIGRQDSTGSQTSSPHGSYSFNDSSRSNYSFAPKVSTFGSHPQNHREDLNRVSRLVPSSPLRNAGSSKDPLEAAEITIGELRAEARMWEQNARKLMIDLENLQKESFDQSKHQKSLEVALSTAQAECDCLKEEVKQVKILLEESQMKQAAAKNLKFQTKNTDNVQKELEDEIKFQREENANLALQLKKTQESNIELVSILQELEETIEKQKVEIDNLSSMKSEFEELGKADVRFEGSQQIDADKQVSEMQMIKSSDSDGEIGIVEHQRRRLHAENGNLELQFQLLHESHRNLESTIQFLEKTLEEKNHEMEIEQGLMSKSLMDCEAEWRGKLAEKDEKIINLEMKLSEALDGQGLKDMGSEKEGNVNLIKEIEALKLKVQELERDCNELTDENLELLFKLKESRKDHSATSNSLLPDHPGKNSLSRHEPEVTSRDYEDELNKKHLIEVPSADHLQIQPVILGNKCADLELQLEAFKDKTSYLDGELSKCRARAEEKEVEYVALQRQFEHYQQTEIESQDQPGLAVTESRISESPAAIEISKLLAELDEQIRLSLADLKLQYALNSLAKPEGTCGSNDSEILKRTDFISQKQQVEIILNNFVQLKQFFGENSALGDEEYSKEAKGSAVSADDILDKLEDYKLKELRSPCEEDSDLGQELSEKISEIEKLKSDNLLKEDELEALRHQQKELEALVSSVQKDKRQLEENIEIMLREGAVAAKCLDDLRSEMMVLNSNMDSQISANKILVKKSSELESGKQELEVHLSELEEENVQLSERICGLEAQLRYLTDERESRRLELQDSESQAMNFKEEIIRLENVMEAQKVDMRQKMEEMQKRWLEVKEECEHLKIANPKLQATSESLIEECSLLQKANGELRKQKMELHEHCTVLEAELKESEKAFSNMVNEVEALEEKYSTMLEEIASKEKALNLELEVLIQENKKQKEKLVLEESLLNQKYLEKTAEVENLQKDVAHLTEQISATQDQKEKTASEAVLEVSHLRADKRMLEAALQDVQGKLKLSVNKLNALQVESETEIQGLKEELAVAKQKQEILMADHEKLLDLLEDVKSNEDKLKGTVRGLELKLKASEYENQQLEEEISSLKVQLQKTALLQDEILTLKKTISETKFENEKLEASFQMLSRDHEELKVERTLLVQKISNSQQAVSELDDCRRRKVALEEKVLRLQGDLTAREALGTHEAALKNELAQIRRENSQFQRKIKYLEEEKEECLKKAQGLEEELMQIKQDQCECKNSIGENNNLLSSGKLFTEMDQGQHHLDENHTQVDNNQNCNNETSQVTGVDLLSKIQNLENELAEALEANDMYKSQLQSLLSKEVSFHSDVPEKSTGEDRCECKASSLETELKELRERYFHMSLKYAEVEDQREQLVMQLKAASGRRSWFS
ncbi:putative WEB family protein At1g65010, chloroplastic isoform X2 [Durio zibethinus]|uniref:WEB family protein At1g65010, chloroplastic isoform X2 n=1 Tax=Durio zibethinus TaxID=66656 RepID=A0A6P6AKW2_DURZI|nr:putative WEB family protein At1g65010, chloroplastic isoform X2 [Durio zibethinus]